MSSWGNLGKVHWANPDVTQTLYVSRGGRFLPTIGSRADVKEISAEAMCV